MYPVLSFTYLLPDGALPTDTTARARALRGTLEAHGAVTVEEVPTGHAGPDRDTQFLALELGMQRVTCSLPSGARWTIRAADLERKEGGRAWAISGRHAGAKVEGAGDWHDVMGIHALVTRAFTALGFRETSFAWPSHVGPNLIEPLRETGFVTEAGEMMAHRAEALLDPTLLLDAWTPTLALRDAAYLDIESLLAAMPTPERFSGIDLRNCGLRMLPTSLARFVNVDELDLGDNPVLCPDVATLTSMPKLRTLIANGTGIDAATQRALTATGLRVRV